MILPIYWKTPMIKITQGDKAVLNLAAKRGGAGGAAHNLTGATFETKIKKSDGTFATYADGQHAIVSASAGTFTLTLSTTDTAALAVGAGHEIVTKVTQSGDPIHFRGKVLTVVQTLPEI